MNRIIVLVLSFIAFKAGACSFAPALEEFIITERSPVAATKPNFSVDSIKRGTNDGNRNSCSDAGFINLKLDSASSNDQGYIFKIVEGKFEDQLFYPLSLWKVKKGIVSFGLMATRQNKRLLILPFKL